jgi:two-component system, OmpR family, sensor histidine kinase BaeS
MEGLMDGVFPAEAEVFQKVHREAARLENLVRDLQVLSRAESGALAFHPQAVQPVDLVDRVCTQLERQFQEKRVHLIEDVPFDLPAVMADRDRIGQVLLNLLGNALQYTPGGGQVRISAFQEGMFVVFRIEDTGIGIDPEHLGPIFARFYRVDKSRSRISGGSGIGLTIAKNLVEASGGEIHASSPGAGRGSTFEFTLPQAEPPDSPVSSLPTSLPNL